MMNRISGSPPMSLMPPSAQLQLVAVAGDVQHLLLGEALESPPSMSSIWRSRLMLPVIVFQFVSMPPSQRWFT